MRLDAMQIDAASPVAIDFGLYVITRSLDYNIAEACCLLEYLYV